MSKEFNLQKYTPNWKRRYRVAFNEISSALKVKDLNIEHVGSTSVPGLTSKPEIDIAIGVKDLNTVANWVEKFKSINYLYYPRFESMTPNRRYFRKGTKKRPLVHVHIYQENDPVYIEMIKFRDLLRSNKNVMKEYENLKKKLAKETEHDRNKYTEDKYEYIKRVLKNT